MTIPAMGDYLIKRNKNTMENENVLYFDRNVNCTGVHVFQNILLCT